MFEESLGSEDANVWAGRVKAEYKPEIYARSNSVSCDVIPILSTPNPTAIAGSSLIE
jgi:hypothetical protein